jgi:hypothetical protein
MGVIGVSRSITPRSNAGVGLVSSSYTLGGWRKPPGGGRMALQQMTTRSSNE